ncbi:prolactin [Xenopus tropicalis]|uniref:Prolactin n=1 Tax=Xenopus tropicalis TaxID=8364 RepID=A0A8J1K137_XENTR|nr:prolactin [Xenopus tropicalis]
MAARSTLERTAIFNSIQWDVLSRFGPAREGGAVQQKNQRHNKDKDQRFSQGRQFLGKSMSSCHTSLLSTPEDKDQALQRHHDDLINLVQKLLRSWNQPLQHLALEAPDNMASKVKEVEEHAKILQGGIDRIAGRMQSNLGDDFYPQWFGPLDPRMPKGDSESYALYHLLHCFRRDSNKIDNYLKILRCRMVHASNC